MHRISDSRCDKRKRPSKKTNKGRNLVAKRWKHNETNLSSENTEPSSPTFSDPQPSTSTSLPPVSTIVSTPVSRSQRKLQRSETTQTTETCITNNNYVLFHTTQLKLLFEKYKCFECNNQKLNVELGNQSGFAANVIVTCTSCSSISNLYNSPRVASESSRPPFDVNERMVESFIEIGRGHAGLEKFCMHMGMNCISSASYYKHFNDVTKHTPLLREEVLKIAHNAVRQAHMEANADVTDEDTSTIDIMVSYDGTWQKRGHTSLFGIGIAIDVLTGLVVDYEILSKYCSVCKINSKKMGVNNDNFKKWYDQHKESGNCEENYNGSSNAMEVFAAEALWKRSITFCNMRYTTVLSDGDAKTLSHLQSLKVYGTDVSINKEECLNHVAKRVGTGLRKIISEWRIKGVTLGGKKEGSLTAETVLKLTNFYRAAIKNNTPNVQNMKTAIFATLYHCKSTDANPQHQKCPGGEHSWCFYNRAIATGNKPPKHDKSTMKTVLSEAVVGKILPVYQRLASNELLERCASGKTQNANESLHSVIWNKCPKEVFVSKKKLEIAVLSAISEFNMGCEATVHLKKTVQNVDISHSTEKISMARDKRRIQESVKKSSESGKKVRKNIQKSKSFQEKKHQKSEGVMYAAGSF